jgi:hypothetical protein
MIFGFLIGAKRLGVCFMQDGSFKCELWGVFLTDTVTRWECGDSFTLSSDIPQIEGQSPRFRGYNSRVMRGLP